MHLAFIRLTLIVLLAADAGAARRRDFDISLDLMQGTEKPSTRPARALGRGSVHARSTELFAVRWKVTRTAKDAANNILVHLYVVRLEREGEAPPPLEPKRVVLESALTMDFPTEAGASGEHHFRVREPGIYLVRVEARPEAEKPGGEQFSELDLIVQ